MKKIILTLAKDSVPKNYPIFIGNHIIEKIGLLFDLKKYSAAFIITDKNIKPLFLDKLQKALKINSLYYALPTGEKEKNINNIEKIWNAMLLAKCDRKTLVLNLGGGVIGDIGGFAASTFMRGVDFLNIPTTLLSQVDSSIGGKNGINLSEIKNLIGTFNQPLGVIIDIQTLKSLPTREFLSGFAEIIKHGLIKDRKYFNQITDKPPLKYDSEEMADIILRSCQIKWDIVKSDETEKSQRKLLNFGHTIGHAIEALSVNTKNSFFHGEAVSIGMAVEAKISYLLKLIKLQELEIINNSLSQTGLPISFSNIATESILKKIASDKKNEKGNVYFTLISGIGKAIYNQIVPNEIIIQALGESTITNKKDLQ